MSKKLLWIGDHSCDSGFARISHQVLKVLHERGWDITVLGINYLGEPPHRDFPYRDRIYPASLGGDLFGVGRVKYLMNLCQPDVVFILNDPWNISAYMDQIDGRAPVVASMPVDGKNVSDGKLLNQITLSIFWTEFGLQEARKGGFTGSATIVPLGVDLDIYKPYEKALVRKQMLPPKYKDAFIVGNVNRNQLRKRLDLTIQYFCEWVKDYGVKDAHLFLHVAPTGDPSAIDTQQLMRYYGFSGEDKRLILRAPSVQHGETEETMAATYSCFDVQVSTTQGEGWGLTTLEGMACGVPQLLPDWSALGEWTRDAAMKVFCSGRSTTPGGINMIGGVPDKEDFIEKLNSLYRNEALRRLYSTRGINLAHRPEFRWENIANIHDRLLEAVLLAVETQKAENAVGTSR